MLLYRLWHNLSSSLWLVPLLCVLGGIILALGTAAIDRYFGYGLIPQSVTGSPNAAQTILNMIATSMVTLTSIALTLTLVAVQLAMGQFSPRIVRALLSDYRTQLSIGLFAATIAYSMLTLREVDPQGGVLPGLATIVAYLLMLASIITLILYVHHASQKLRVGGLIDFVGDELRKQLDDSYPVDHTGATSNRHDERCVVAPKPGVIIRVDHQGLVAAARSVGCVLEMVPTMGDFVPAGAPLFRVHGEPEGLDSEKIAHLVALGHERTHDTDPAFGFRKLVDIAERSVVQPFNDPTTAVQAIDRLHDCMRQLAPRPFPSGRHYDEQGELRLVVRTIGWDGYVRLAFDELRLAGAYSPQVARRLRAALEDLKTVAPPERQPVLDRQLDLLKGLVSQIYEEEEEEIGASLTADQQGIGSGQDVIATDGQPNGLLPSDREGRRSRRTGPAA
jgi:uncharacterized membrane protein